MKNLVNYFLVHRVYRFCVVFVEERCVIKTVATDGQYSWPPVKIRVAPDLTFSNPAGAGSGRI